MLIIKQSKIIQYKLEGRGGGGLMGGGAYNWMDFWRGGEEGGGL